MGRNTLVEYWVGDFSLSNDEARSAAIVSIVVLSFVGLASAITLTDKRWSLLFALCDPSLS